MERLIADASKMTDVQKELNVSVKDGDMSFGNIVNAISVMQKSLGIAGTTSKEASETISGSIQSAKSAFQNFLSGAGSVKEVTSTFETALKNISNAVIKIAPRILEGIPKILAKLVPKILDTTKKMSPILMQSVVQLIKNMTSELPQITQMFIDLIPIIISGLTSALTQIAPLWIPMAFKIQNQIYSALIENIPVLLASLPVIISALITGFINSIPQLIMMAPQLMIGLVTGLLNALPILIGSVPTIIKSFINSILSLLPNFISAGGDLIKSLKNGVLQAFNSIPSNVKTWVANKIINPIKDKGISGLKNVGKNLIKGLWEGISNMGDWCISKIKGMGKSILKSVKDIFGVHSPSREFAWIGKMNMTGLEQGMEDMQPEIQKAIDGMFDLSPSLYGSASNNLSPNINLVVNNNIEQDPLGQMVSKVKTFSGGAKNDYNWGSGL